MTDKQQIEQLKEALQRYVAVYGKTQLQADGLYTTAELMSEFGIVALPENAVVLSREELSKRDYEFRQIGYDECLRDNPKKDIYIKALERKIDQLNAKLDQARKETAKEILQALRKKAYTNNYCQEIILSSELDELAKQYDVEVEE